MKISTIVRLSGVLLASSVLLSGCIKETVPQGSGATSEQINDSPLATEGSLAAMPTILITNYLDLGEHIDFGYPGLMGATDRLVGEVFPCGSNQYTDRWQPYMYNTGGLSASRGWGGFFYWNYYQFINTANSILSSSTDTEAIGVAKAFRASWYLDLARLFEALPAKAPDRPAYETEALAVAGLTVPIVREDTTLEQMEDNPRATREEMYTFILSDLNDAEAALTSYQPSSKSYPSLAVVYGLKARTYLWLGGYDESYTSIPTGDAAYRLAAEFARKAIDASGSSITTEEQWLNPQTGFNTVISSWMWAMIQNTDTVLNNLLSWTAHMAVEAVYGYGNLAQPGLSVFSYNRMSSGDFRKKNIVGPTPSYKAISQYTTLTQGEFEEGADASNAILPYAWMKFHTANGEKRNFTTANPTSIPLMRVEEMYLIEAEATAHYDAGTGKSLLQSFMLNRNPKYTVPAAYDLIDEIIFQKRMEFWGEGIIYYDMKRLNIGMQNGNRGTNAPSGATFTTEGRAPWWNIVIPLSSVQQNRGLTGKNNPDPTNTVRAI